MFIIDYQYITYMLEQNLALLFYIFLTVARMINYMCMMDDDYSKLWHYIDFPCCVPSFSHQLCSSVSGQRNINQV